MNVVKIQWVDENEEVLYEQDLTKMPCNLDDVEHLLFSPYPIIECNGSVKMTDYAMSLINEELKKKVHRIRLVSDRVPEDGEIASKYSL